MRNTLKRVSLAVALLLSLEVGAGPPYTVVHTGTTVTTVATLIDTTPTHFFIKVWNNCGQAVYVGFSPAITTTNGVPVLPQAWIEFSSDLAAGNRLYGIVTGTTCDVRTLEVRQ